MWRPSNKEKNEWHLVKNVYPMKDFIIRTHFYDGKVKDYDIKPLFDNKPHWDGKPIFNMIRDDISLYKTARPNKHGFAVIWNDIADLDCEEIYYEGKDIPNIFEKILSFSDACFLWNLNESTLRKAVQYGKLEPGVDCCKYGNQWVVSIDAMTREYGGAPELVDLSKL